MGISFASVCTRDKNGQLDNADLWQSVAEEDEPLRQVESNLSHFDNALKCDKCLYLDNNMAAVAEGALDIITEAESWYFETKQEQEAFKKATELKALVDKLGFTKATLTDILSWDDELSVYGVIQYARHLENKKN